MYIRHFAAISFLVLLSGISMCCSSTTPHVIGDVSAPQPPLPVVLWHGGGDSCCAPHGLGSLIPVLQKHLPGAHVKSLQIGRNVAEDTGNGFYMDVNEQIADVCRQLAGDPLLQGGYNAVGFSQGGQFLRGVAQRCPSPPMRTLISLGGQHQGVYGQPLCLSASEQLCAHMRDLLGVGAYWGWVQGELVQAQYWHDPLAEEVYRNSSLFLADINNEVSVNRSYVDNLTKLTKLVLVRFNNDSMVQPRETSWFGFYAPGQAEVVLPMRETRLYIEDRIGLKQLDQLGRLDLVAVDGEHNTFSHEWFVDEVVLKYLSPTRADNSSATITHGVNNNTRDNNNTGTTITHGNNNNTGEQQ